MKYIKDFNDFLNEDIESNSKYETLNEEIVAASLASSILVSVGLTVGIMAAVKIVEESYYILRRLILNLKKQVYIQKLLSDEQDPEKIKVLKAKLNDESNLEIEMRSKLRDNNKKLQKYKDKIENDKIDSKKLEIEKLKIKKLEDKIYALTYNRDSMKRKRMGFKKDLKKSLTPEKDAKFMKKHYGGNWKVE